MNNYSGPAFFKRFTLNGELDYQGGITILDYFAAAAMQGYFANKYITEAYGEEKEWDQIAKGFYKIAAAMIQERERLNPELNPELPKKEYDDRMRNL